MAGLCPKVQKITCNCMANTDHNGEGKAKIEMPPFSLIQQIPFEQCFEAYLTRCGP